MTGLTKRKMDLRLSNYKTARKLPSQELVDDNLQLLIYLLAFLDRYPDQKPENVKLSLYFLKHSTKLSTVKKVDQVENEKMKIIDLVNQIEGSSFQPRVSPLCGWCGYQKICPMWKHKFRKNQEIKDGKEKEKIIDEYIEIQNKIKTLKKRVAELGEQIQEIMKEEEAERLFSGDMIIARTSRKTWKFDEEKLKNILDEVGMWENVLKVDLAKLKKVSETLPPTLKRQVDDAKYIDGETWSLSIKKSK